MANFKKWEIIGSNWVIHHQWCKVRQDTVKLSNGQIIDDYFVNVRPDIVLVIPITPDFKMVLVRQYRHGIQEFLLELPAGAFESTLEDSLSAAKRELEEETGYLSDRFIPLLALYDNPVKDTNKIHVYLALDATPTGKQELDITEEIELILISVEQIEEKIASGEICVSGSLAAIYLALNFLRRKDKVIGMISDH